MGHFHTHDHPHDHHGHGHDNSKQNQKRVLLVLALTASFMGVELVYGFLANSLALVADSFHMLTDVAALGLTLLAFYISRRPANDKNTFGFYRMEILAAFVNGVLLAVIAIGVLYHAFERLQAPPEVDAMQVIVVAFLGLVLNLVSGFILMRGDQENLNMKGALFHVMGDALASVGTLIASFLIIWKQWYLADPIVSAFIAVIIIFSAYRLISDTVHVILQGVPVHLDMNEVRSSLETLEGVDEIHNLHIWSLSSKMVILTVHIVAGKSAKEGLLERAKALLKAKFHIDHSTIQVEERSLKAQEPSF
jgi:cobalt-zinc-cadmium efflux system protein